MYSVSLGKNPQFAISCVMCLPMDSGPNTDSLGKTQFATSCVMCFPIDSGPKHRFPWKNPNSQLVALCVFLWIRAQTPIPLEKPKPKARGPEAFRLSVCPVWSLGRLVFSSVFSGFKACHVTAAKMLSPLVWHVFGSNLTSPLPPDPGLVGLRLRCGGAFASRRSGHREASCSFSCGKSLTMCTVSGNLAARSVFFSAAPPYRRESRQPCKIIRF